jgi:hypothetical protein
MRPPNQDKFARVTHALIFGLALVSGPVGCQEFKKGYDESFCKSFSESFVKSCTEACATGKKVSAAECETKCREELPKQSQYKSKC